MLERDTPVCSVSLLRAGICAKNAVDSESGRFFSVCSVGLFQRIGNAGIDVLFALEHDHEADQWWDFLLYTGAAERLLVFLCKAGLFSSSVPDILYDYHRNIDTTCKSDSE